jgi:hypothetical protein
MVYGARACLGATDDTKIEGNTEQLQSAWHINAQAAMGAGGGGAG